MANQTKVNIKKPKLPKLEKEKRPRFQKPKMQEIKKPKAEKPKKPRVAKTKKPKEAKPKKEKKPMTKKKLILLILLLLLLGGAAATGYFYMHHKQASAAIERREPPRYDYFTLDSDQIDSITKVVGYKVITDAYGKDIVFEPWYEDSKEAAKAAKAAKKAAEKAAKEKADSKDAEDASTETIPEETTATYVYKDIQTASADVKEYVTYLMDTLEFKEVYPFYIDNPAGYITLSKDSVTEGYFIQIDIDYTKDSYTFTLEKVKKPVEPKEAKAKEKATISRATALDIIKQTPIEVLGLDESLDNLVLMGDPGHSTVDGMDCYGVHVYKTVGENKSTVILGTYYVASDRETIYSYNVMTDKYTKLK